MPVIYNVTIEPTEKEKRFHITWHNMGKNIQDCFTQAAEMTTEEIRWLGQSPLDQGRPCR